MSDGASREEHREVQRRVTALEEGQGETLLLLHEIDKRTTIMHAAIMGDAASGIPGVVGQLAKVKAWINEHGAPDNLDQHIAETVDTPKERKVNGWAIFAACIGALGVIGSLAVAVLK